MLFTSLVAKFYTELEWQLISAIVATADLLGIQLIECILPDMKFPHLTRLMHMHCQQMADYS